MILLSGEWQRQGHIYLGIHIPILYGYECDAYLLTLFAHYFCLVFETFFQSNQNTNCQFVDWTQNGLTLVSNWVFSLFLWQKANNLLITLLFVSPTLAHCEIFLRFLFWIMVTWTRYSWAKCNCSSFSFTWNIFFTIFVRPNCISFVIRLNETRWFSLCLLPNCSLCLTQCMRSGLSLFPLSNYCYFSPFAPQNMYSNFEKENCLFRYLLL